MQKCCLNIPLTNIFAGPPTPTLSIWQALVSVVMFGEWAGEMIGDLTEEFDIPDDRALRITSLIRNFISNPEYNTFDKHEQLTEVEEITAIYDQYIERRDFSYRGLFMTDLPIVLRYLPGETIEERWNHLMETIGYQELADEGVYLLPWAALEEWQKGDVNELKVARTPPSSDESPSEASSDSTIADF